MRKTTTKSRRAEIKASDVEFLWPDDLLAETGLSRPHAHLAWLLLHDCDPKEATSVAGFDEAVSAHAVGSTPEYAKAMQILHTIYLNSIAGPRATVELVDVASDRTAAPAARAAAAGRLLDHAQQQLDRAKARRSADPLQLDLDALSDLIRKLELERGDRAKDVQLPVLPQAEDNYLVDLFE